MTGRFVFLLEQAVQNADAVFISEDFSYSYRLIFQDF